ncbi:hypothetical protein [Streptomyces sp. NPDC003273]|uniref:hypothetical protein n=1 Tax=Streptomyces sp. NPDC003273 TaxID=3364678 RepID=UPI0036C5A5D1
MLDPRRTAQNNPQTPSPAQPPARPSRAVTLAGAGLGSVGSLTLTLTGAPWPAVLVTAVAGLIVVLAQSFLQALAPQDSHDRLTWWTNLWAHRARHHTSLDTPGPETPPPASAQNAE